VKLAFLGYFFLGDRNIEPKEVIATDSTPGVAGHFSDTAELKAMVQADVRAAKKKADHVIPFFHWGREGRAQPEPYQVELGHAAIEAGASAVIGSRASSSTSSGRSSSRWGTSSSAATGTRRTNGRPSFTC
jgi:poly-gamma-glutamate synthesis protein (capsule biosynthesis protein)